MATRATHAGEARAIRTPAWSFVQAVLDHPESDPSNIDRLTAQAFEVPKPDGTWTIVLLPYRDM